MHNLFSMSSLTANATSTNIRLFSRGSIEFGFAG